MGSVGKPQFDVRKVAVIGAGPCGLAAAKYLRDQGAFESITLFEQQSEVGGIWNYSEVTSQDCPVPQEDPFYPPDAPVQRKQDAAPIFPSALYNNLCANIPGTLMGFSDHGFPRDALLFPHRTTIQDVLVSYAKDVRHFIKFCHQVTEVTRQSENDQDKWLLQAERTTDSTTHSDVYDAVVMANGHYSVPNIPSIKGIEAFQAAHPHVISHSKNYRTPDIYAGKKVLVVGNGPSGVDIAAQVNATCQKPALLSVRSPTTPALLEYTGCEEVAEIEEFLPEQQGVRLVDGSVIKAIDAIIFCTGFMFSYPFLPELQHRLITHGKGVHGLYKHFICIDHPTLMFPCLNMKAIPWPVAEVQAAVFSAIWSNNLDLPPAEEMRKWSEDLEAEKGVALHVFDRLADGHFINELHDWSQQARSKGKTPPRWGEELSWQRSIFAQAKLRFELQGRNAKTLEDIGFQYEPGAYNKSLKEAKEEDSKS
ncbi:FAD/NAD(P)-binding domain-containing protein [Sarocladium strictum]